LARLVDRLVAAQTSVELLKRRRTILKRETLALEAKMAVLAELEGRTGEAAALLKKVAEICEGSSKEVMERIVNHGLQAIFDETDTFHIDIETKARSVYAYLRLGEDSKTGIMDSRGGGYVDIISVLTVLVLILQKKKDMQRFLVLDEAFAEVGRDHLEKVGQFLRFLVEKLDMTVLLITHSEEFMSVADRVYHVQKKGDGPTTIKQKEIQNG
jgi:hypothetical protein